MTLPRRLPKEHELSRSPCNYWQQEQAAVSIEVPLPQWTDPQRKEMMRDMCAFVVKQIRKRNVELTERKLTAEERVEFEKAKGKEVNNYVSSRVFSLLPSHLKPDVNQAMAMRWILTWKTDESGGKEGESKMRHIWVPGSPVRASANSQPNDVPDYSTDLLAGVRQPRLQGVQRRRLWRFSTRAPVRAGDVLYTGR